MLLHIPDARDGPRHKQVTPPGANWESHTVGLRAEPGTSKWQFSGHHLYCDKSLLLMSMSSNVYGEDNGPAAVTMVGVSAA